MTIKDISAQTGYSVGTISRVLNNQPNVSEKARTVILAAAEASGFQLNTNAKQLKQQRTNAILAVVKGISNRLFGSLLEALQARVADLPYPLIVDYLDEDANEVLRGAQLFREKKPQGILFLGGNKENFLADFHRIDAPCVLITGDASQLQLTNLSSVTMDDRQAGFLAIEHLAKLGHRRIAVIGGQRDNSDITQLRFEGCLEAMRQYDVPFDETRDYYTGRYSFADGYKAAVSMAPDRGYTAVFAMADVMAIGAIRGLRDLGLRVPEDISVIGIDGLVPGDYIVPRLTTIRQSLDALADNSISLLLQQFQGRHEAHHQTIAPTVDVKESTRPL